MKILFSNHWGIVGESPELLNYTNSWMGDAYTAGVRKLVEIGNKFNVICEPFSKKHFNEADAFCIWEAPRIANNERNVESYQMIMGSGKPIYAILTEPLPVDPENLLETNALFYDKIFTWQCELIDDYKYIAIRPMCFGFETPKNTYSYKEKKLCVMIGHILSDLFLSKDAIYNKRAEILDWFTLNQPKDIELYGKQPYGIGKLQQYPFFKGNAVNKRETLANYKFSFCYENSRFDDYITEKLFDCFLSKCVPIYIGAPNVTEYVPANAFINPENFESLSELVKFLKNMSENEYANYLEAAEFFLKTPFAQSYKPDFFAKTVLRTITGADI